MKNYIKLIFISLLYVQCSNSWGGSSDALDYCAKQVALSLESLEPHNYKLVPRNVAPGDTEWNLVEVRKEEWCAGFWSGILWYNYENTHNAEDLKYAKLYTEALSNIAKSTAYDHDLGFLIFCSFGNGYRLTHNQSYKEAILTSANNLSKLFNPNTGTILSWPREVKTYGGHNTIIDNMINLEMLFWASENGGDKTIRDIAISHADKSMETLFRKDGTLYRVAIFNPTTGEHMRSYTHQGDAEEMMWARGQAWGIYGFTMCYRYTKDIRYLKFAEKIAKVFIDNLPEDMVSFCDYFDTKIPNTYRDTSATAAAASALLELSTYVTDKDYRQTAEAMLESLDKNYRNNNAPALLVHSTGSLSAGAEIGYSTIYADYYYYEALLRLKKIQEGKTI